MKAFVACVHMHSRRRDEGLMLMGWHQHPKPITRAQKPALPHTQQLDGAAFNNRYVFRLTFHQHLN